jgi:hypothetical protein
MAKRSGGHNIGKVARKKTKTAERRQPAAAVAAEPGAGQPEEVTTTRVATIAAPSARPIVAERAARAKPLTPTYRRPTQAGAAAMDYSYVGKELRRIAILTGLIVLILILLTFWLR